MIALEEVRCASCGATHMPALSARDRGWTQADGKWCCGPCSKTSGQPTTGEPSAEGGANLEERQVPDDRSDSPPTAAQCRHGHLLRSLCGPACPPGENDFAGGRGGRERRAGNRRRAGRVS